MRSKKTGKALHKCLSVMLVLTLVMGLIASVGVISDPTTVQAATFAAEGSGVTAPAFNAANFPTLNTTASTKYYFGQYGNAFYGVSNGISTAVTGTGQASGTVPYWELVDTDASMNGTSLSSTWGSGSNGQTILNYTNGLKSTYFSGADQTAMKSAGADIVTNDYTSASGSISASSAYLWPLSYTQLNANKTLGGAIFSGAGDYVWTRSYSDNSYDFYYAWYVGNTSGVLINYGNVTYSYRVAPAFNLDLEKVLIARSASSATASQSLSAASVVSGDVKFLINAGSAKSSFAVPAISGKTLTNVFAGSTYTFDYSGAGTTALNGGTNYVSAIIYDKNGRVLYYGNLGTISAASGTASITIPRELDSSHTGETYTLALFQEEKCAANKTDYASAPVYANFTVKYNNYETNATFTSTQNSSVHVGDTISADSFKANVSYLNGTSDQRNVYILSSTDYAGVTDKRTISNTSVEVPNGSKTFKVTAIFIPTYTEQQSYWTEEYTYNLIYETGTVFSTSHDSSFSLNDTFTSADFAGTITWSDGQTSAVSADDMYIVPTSTWGTGLTKAQVQALTDYNGGKSIKVDDGELDGKGSYSITAVYFPTVSGAEAVHSQAFEFASATLYPTAFEASYSGGDVEYGDLLTDQEFSGKYTLSDGDHTKVEASTKYVLPSATWSGLSDSVKGNESQLKKVKGINSIVIPSKTDLGGAASYDVTVIYYDYSEQHSHGGGTAGVNCNYYEAEVSVPLVTETVSEYSSYTANGITWYYQLDGDENAINVHTLNEDVSQIIDKNGVLNIPAKVDGHYVKSIGAGTKDTPFIPKSINSFTSISFPANLSDINDYAFYANTAFVRLVIPASVGRIGNFAFYDCDNISDVKIDSTAVGSAAFGNCDGIIEVTISGTGSVGRVAFAKCSNLTKLTIGGTVNIGKSAFSDDTNINAINLKELTGATIEAYAFKDDTAIKEVYIPANNEVKAYAFDGCEGITNLELDMTTVENESFSRCGNIQYLIFGENVETVEYNWGGYSSDTYDNNSSYTDEIDTTIYVKNIETKFVTYTDGSDYYSSFMGHYVESGSYKYARKVSVYTLAQASSAGKTESDGKVTAPTSWYQTNRTETQYGDLLTAKGLLTITFSNDNETSEKTVNLPSTRDGITAYYDGKIYDNAKADKEKIVVNPIYSDAATATESIKDFYFYDADGVDAAIRAWIKNDSSDAGYTLENNSGNDAIDAWISARSGIELTWDTYQVIKELSDVQENGTDEQKTALINADWQTFKKASVSETQASYNFTDEQLEAQLDAMVADVFTHRDLFLIATADVIDNPEIVTLSSEESYKIQHMEVIYYPSEDGDEDYHENEPVYYQTSFDVKVVKYTDEMYFFDQGFSYSTVVTEIKSLESKIADLSAQVDSLQSANNELAASNSEKDAELSNYKQQLDQYTAMYNEMVEELNKYIDSSNVDENGYFGEVETEKQNEETGETETVTKQVVWVGGEECDYAETDQTVEIDGITYDVYTGTGDLDGDGEAEEFEFYVNKAGVHIIEKDDETGEYEEIENYSDPIRALERQLTAQLTAVRTQLSDVNDKIDALKAALQSALDIEDSEFEGKTMDEQLAIIVDKVNDLVEEKNTLESQISANDEKLKAYEEAVDSIFDELVSGDLDKEDFATLQAKLDQIMTDIAAIKTENEGLSTQVTSLNSQISSLNTQIEAKDAEIAEKEKTIAEKDKQISDLTDSLGEKDASIEDLSEQINTLKTQADALSTTISEQSETISSLESNVSDLTQANDEMKSEIASLNSNVTSLSESNAAQKEKIDSLSDTLAEKQAAIDAGTATIEELTEKIKTAQATITELQTENSNQAETISALESSVNTLTALNNTQKTTIDGLKNDISDLQEQNESLSGTISTLQSTITSQQAEIANLNDAITSKNAEITTAKNTISSLNTQIAGLQSDLTTAQATIASQTEQISDLEASAGNYILTVDDAAELFGTSRTATRAEVKEAINAFVASKVSSEKTISDIQEKLGTDATGDALVALVGYAGSGSGSGGDSSTDATVAVLVAENNSLKSQVSTLTSEKTALTTQVATLTAKNTELEGQVTSLTNALVTATKTDDSTLAATVASLTEQLTTANAKNATLTSENTSLKSENATLENENETLSATNDTLKKKNSTLTSTNSTLQSQNDTLTSSNSNLNNQISSLSGQVSTLTNEKNTLTGQVNTLTAEKNNLTSQVQSLQSQSRTASTSGTTSATGSTGSSSNTGSQSTTATSSSSNSGSTSGKTTDNSTTGTKNSDSANTASSTTESVTDTTNRSAGAASESSTQRVGVSSTIVAEDDPITIMNLPSNTNYDEKSATVEILDTSVTYAKGERVRGNAASYEETTDEQKEHANAIFAYYAGHLDELAALGYDEASEIKDNDEEMLDIEAIFSADVKPSNSQKTAMEENRKVQLTLTHDELKNGEEYLVVHESTERDGKYDVLLVTAENNSITLSLQDLSPISVAKLSVESVTALVAGATEGAPSPAGEAVVAESGNTNLIFAIILIVLIAGGALALVFFMKQRQKNGGGFNFHRA